MADSRRSSLDNSSTFFVEKKTESTAGLETKQANVASYSLKPFPFETSQMGKFYAFNDVKKQLKILSAGVDFLTDYYRIKYSSEIARPKKADGDFVDATDFLESGQLERDIQAARNQGSDFRRTYVLVKPLESHKVSLTYIREQGKEALVYIDTVGKEKNWTAQLDSAFKKFSKDNKIKVYVSKDQYQTDTNSCGVMSTVLGRDITSKNKDDKDYELGGFISYLKKHSNRFGDIKFTTLPAYLVKLSQVPERLDELSKDKSIVNVHEEKGETLAEFRARYKGDVITSKGVLHDADSYAVTKGGKYQKLIAILFYLEQVKKLLPAELSKSEQLQFVKDAKEHLRDVPITKANKYLIDFTNDYLKAKSPALESPTPTPVAVNDNHYKNST